jgi:hypothetical protein
VKRVTVFVLALVTLPAHRSGGQTQYFNLEAGRPTRVDDAVPTERYALDVELAPVRIERLDGGSYRWRAEPKLSFGALPFTEFELRVPYSGVRSRDRSGVREHGVASMALGMLHALNLETTHIPALALAAEAQLPVGTLAAPRATYSVKVLATKSRPAGRVHLNLAGGTYSVRVPSTDACAAGSPTSFGCGGFIPDVPCSVAPVASLVSSDASRANSVCNAGAAARQPLVSTPRTHGPRWLAGVGVDHACPLSSSLLTADFIAERFQGFQSKTDMTVEAGTRWQWSPRLVLDAGVSRRFAGATTSSAVTIGLTFTAIVRPRSVAAAAVGPGK